MKISAYSLVHNAIKGDYCITECVLSLLAGADEVVVADAASNDGTKELLAEMEKEHPKLRVVHQEWEQPVNDPKWFVRWINSVRVHLKHPYQMMLDADEVLDESAWPAIRKAAQADMPLWFSRLNFYRDARHLCPHGETCGHEVVRCGPSRFFMPSDEPYGTQGHPGPEPPIKRYAKRLEPLPVIYHYGFLRPLEGMIHKSKVNLMGFFGGWDKRLTQAALDRSKPWHSYLVHSKPLLTYSGEHPKHCHKWLKDRGAL